MDLISRESLINKLDPWYKKIKKTAPNNLAEGFMQVDGLIRHEPSAFEGMTNGEVMKAVFESDNVQFDETGSWIHIIINGMDYSFCPVEFWNAPYKAESEGTE